MKKLRPTLSDFENLEDYDFEPRFRTLAGTEIRQLYIDEGNPDDALVLLLHGVPTWSYLFRHTIRALNDAGLRAVAPDFIGFGKSDRLVDANDHTYERHVRWTKDFIDELVEKSDSKSIHLVCHDWGGFIGLRLAAQTPSLFASVVVSSSSLPVGLELKGSEFLEWEKFSADPNSKISEAIQKACRRPLSADTLRAYDAPFLNLESRAALARFPKMIPRQPGESEAVVNQIAWASLSQFDRPTLTIFGQDDRVAGGAEIELQKRIPGARGEAHQRLTDAGHFVPEDQPDAFANLVASFIDRARSRGVS